MGYQIPVLEQYVEKYNSKVHVVHWDHKKLTTYAPPVIKNVTYYKRSKLNAKTLCGLIDGINPEIVYVSGWMDKSYLKACAELKKKGIPVVAGCDNQWKATIRQRLGVVYFKFFMDKYFDYLWVPGPFQFEFARRLGFAKNRILFNCYSADVELFTPNNLHNSSLPHRFLFLGRFEKVKGVELLAQAWNEIENTRHWTLTFIGNGSLKEKLSNYPNIEVKEFIPPELLKKEISRYGCLILPSLSEPYALVIHEAMAAGLPVLATEVCGAAPVFILNGYNGYTFQANSIEILKGNMQLIMNMPSLKFKEMSINALKQSEIITPEITAASFMSILNKP